MCRKHASCTCRKHTSYTHAGKISYTYKISSYMCRKYSCTCSFLPARAGNIPTCVGTFPAHICFFLHVFTFFMLPAPVYCMCRKFSCMSFLFSAWVCREYTCTYLLSSCTHPTCVHGNIFPYTHLFLPPCVEACLHKYIPAHE